MDSPIILPNLDFLGNATFVPFLTSRVEGANVLWLNDRWFMRSGVNTLDQNVRRQITDTLLEDFGVNAVQASEHIEDFTVFKTFYADRYGGTLGSLHGGSGRNGFYKSFNAKGVGRTPLVSEYGDWEHSHGFLSLHEAIREVINTEIADAELPHGAVPVLAIIDLGMSFRPHPQGPYERAAVLVRANFVRPAHFERSIYFGNGGTVKSEQHQDGLRVRQAVFQATSPSSESNDKTSKLELHDMFVHFAEQIGAARAHRLWQGRFLTSNVAISGAMVDFGSFRSVPNWCNATGLPGESFGHDDLHLDLAVDSLTFYFNKFRHPDASPIGDTQSIKRKLKEVTNRSFLDASVRSIGNPNDGNSKWVEYEAYIWAYYAEQQKHRYDAESPATKSHPWLYDFLIGSAGNADRATSREIKIAQAITSRLKSDHYNSKLENKHAYDAIRWLKPRPALYLDNATTQSKSIVNQLTSNHFLNSKLVTEYIRRTASISLRVWSEVPKCLCIIGQYTDLFSKVLYCLDDESQKPTLYIEAQLVDKYLCLCGQFYSIENRGRDHQTNSVGVLKLTISMPPANQDRTYSVEIYGCIVTIPPADYVYDTPFALAN